MTISIALILIAWLPLCAVATSPKAMSDAMYYKTGIMSLICIILALYLQTLK